MAQLAAGQEAFVSGPSAGALYGLRNMPRRCVEITVHQQRRIHAASPRADSFGRAGSTSARDVVVRSDGLRVASPLRMLFGLAVAVQRSSGSSGRPRMRGIDSSSSPTTRPSSLPITAAPAGRVCCGWSAGWNGRSSGHAPAQSGLELDVIAIAERAGLPAPVRQHPIVLPNGETIHLDLAWPEVRLAVEPGHSWWHGGDLRHAGRSGQGSRVRRGRLAHHPLRRVRARRLTGRGRRAARDL